MASRRLRPLTADDLPQLPDPCGRCTFWECSLGELAASVDHLDRTRRKIEWAEAVTERWGYCGVAAVNDGTLIGYVTMAPGQLVPRLGAFASAPVSVDAAVLMAGQVVAEHRGSGVGRQLVQAMAGLLVRRDIRAVEAVGTYSDGPSCLLPAGWLEAVGFTVVRPHPSMPRLRMDLQTSLRWRPDLGAAWHRLAGLVTQPPAPEPAAYAPREGLPHRP